MASPAISQFSLLAAEIDFVVIWVQHLHLSLLCLQPRRDVNWIFKSKIQHQGALRSKPDPFPRMECIFPNQGRGSALNLLLLPVNKHSWVTVSCFPTTARHQLSHGTRATQWGEVRDCSPLRRVGNRGHSLTSSPLCVNPQ